MGKLAYTRMKAIMIVAILILAIIVAMNTGVASAVTSVSTCGNLSTPGETYILSNDIITTGTCFTIAANGITLDGDGHTITGSGFFHGVLLSGSTDVTIKNLTVKSFGAGISLVSSNGNTLTSNTISNNGFGIWLFSSSSSNTLTSNTASSNSIGIMLDFPSSSNTLTSNTVSSNRVGIDCNGSDGNTLTSNTISNNAFFGIRLFCFNNQIYNNNFINNPTQASVLFGRTGNVFNLAAPTGGNFWSNYDTPAEDCNNLNGDNFCDTPFFFSGGQDNLPWTKKDGWLVTDFPITLTVTKLQLRVGDANEKVHVGASFTLAMGSDGINPATQPVSLKLSTPTGGQFYPAPANDFMPINGFDFDPNSTPPKWSINAAEKQRTGVQSFDILEGFSLNLVDTKAQLGTRDYSQVIIDFRVGNDIGSAEVQLVENPVGSGNWQLA